MKTFRIATAAALTLVLSGVPAFAGDLASSVTAAATAAAKSDAQDAPMKAAHTSNKTLLWGGTALFAAGMAYGLTEFINNKNGTFSEFGEAAATNKKAGAAGLGLAFAGGTIMLLGKHAGRMPSLTFGAKAVGVAKKLSW